LGLDLLPIRRKQDPPRQTVNNIPPYNGFGSEEDSLKSYYYLTPRVSVRKIIEQFKKDKHVLRFNSRMISGSSLENDRRFVFMFYVGDSTMQIYEQCGKNSGRISSKFKERTKVKNPYTNQYYSEKELFVGANIYCNKCIFRIEECDEKTATYMKDNCDVFRDSDIEKIIRRIQKEACKFNSMNDYLVTLISRIDPEKRENVCCESILKGLSS
jgi:hypothetical protein